MQKTELCTITILILLILSAVSVQFAKSQSTTNLININADGSIYPQTTPILRNGNIYKLTDNISGSVAVHKSNIVIDGAGYALNGNGGTGIDLTGNLTEYPSIYEIRNVTIENLGIVNFNYSINARGSSQNTFYNDYIANTTSDVHGGVLLYWNAGGNNITHCTIIGTPYAIGIELSSGNTITGNNLSGGVLMQFAGNETVDRNYWSDYSTRYPNAIELDSSGIGNTPYVLDTYGTVNGTLQDNHPLMNPVTLSTFPTASVESVPEFPKMIILTLLIAATLPVLLVFFKKHKD
jgi:parallel beta-helix repeat protein